jgi:CxxC motif-containing protein (DUF1111 family)
MELHMGIQPAETVGFGIDEDGDGVTDEVLPGELSALEIFVTTTKRPVELERGPGEERGFEKFQEIGCAECHRPSLVTSGSTLPYAFPEVETDMEANVYYRFNLRDAPPAYEPEGSGILVKLFSDLKRHDMGEGLSENFFEDQKGKPDDEANREFLTARLWGVADTAPYLHDGRALTLASAIELHGGKAQDARDAFVGLTDADRADIVAFLRTLRNPRRPNEDLLGP